LILSENIKRENRKEKRERREKREKRETPQIFFLLGIFVCFFFSEKFSLPPPREEKKKSK